MGKLKKFFLGGLIVGSMAVGAQENSTLGGTWAGSKKDTLKDNQNNELISNFSAKQESVEKAETLQLEQENYRIAKDLSLEEKLVMGRKKEKVFAGIVDSVEIEKGNGTETYIMVLKKQIDGPHPNAFVREYLDDGTTPKHLVGEQIFNRNAVLNLKLDGKLPNFDQINAIRRTEGSHQELLKKYFQKDGENIFPGSFHSGHSGGFFVVGKCADYWLINSGVVGIYMNDMRYYSEVFSSDAFSLRFLKK